MRESVASLTVDDSDPRDPSARCDRCGTQGTIARAIRHSEPLEIFRYCINCWPAAQEDLERRQTQELNEYHQASRAWDSERLRDPKRERPKPPAPWSGNSRSWSDVQRFLELITAKLEELPRTTPPPFPEIAAEIQATAAQMVGHMPAEVAEFLAKYLPPSA
jgi:hypothetical protein